MCKPTSTSHPSPAKSKKASSGGGIAKYAFYFVAALPVLLFAVLPALISEASGGYTSVYTNNPNKFSNDKIPNMAGKVAIVSGGTAGIGFETAKQLVFAGAEVILTARSKAKGDAAVERIVNAYADKFPEATQVQVKSMVCDQSSLQSVRQFVAEFKKLSIPLHLLVLNAGVMKSPGAQYVGKEMTYGFEKTEDGFEQHIGVNHIAHHYMASLLGKQLVAGSPSRVVAVSSSAHSGGYEEGIRPETWKPEGDATPGWYEDGNSYAQSKLANILFAREFAKRMEDSGVTAYSLHPGIIMSELSRYMSPVWEKDLANKSIVEKLLAAVFGTVWISSNMATAEGALTQLYVATAPADELTNGAFYWPIGVETKPAHPQAGNETLQELLWKETEAAINTALKEEKAKRDGENGIK
eukprot:CAMPEP_0181044890 /NCGR_PEP_ID=MMETSP1070-20121207/13510_1 /TAXON_ID=265543 /ORGANISM="Minutocellus polymorphus, Strain NH13" /LENGTH=410 /DNA_ID=CAMNT_0023123371 /DNA_START=71 /DNA_END=1303 /DNA_ORIENTATION=+